MTSKTARSKSAVSEQVSIPKGGLPPSLVRPEDRGNVVAFLLPLARRDALLELLFAGLKSAASLNHPILLVDGGLHESCLPAPLREDARAMEGVSDALFFGASASHVVVQRAEDGSWGYVPTGTPIPDPDRGWTHEAWTEALGQLTPENGTLFLLLPAEFTGARVLAKKADRQITLTAGPERSNVGRIVRLALVLFMVVVAGLAWITGWLAPMGIPVPEGIPPALEEWIRGIPRPRALP